MTRNLSKVPLNRIYRTVFLSAAVLCIVMIAVIMFRQGREKTERRSLKEHFVDARKAVGAGEYGEAILIFEKILRADPGNAEAHNMLGILQAETGAADASRTSFEKAVESGGISSKAYYNLGNQYRREGDFDRAIEYYRKAISLENDYVPPRLMLAEIFDATKRKEEALVQYEEISRIEKQLQEDLLSDRTMFGRDYYKRFFEAKDAYNKGFLLERKGKFDEALAEYDRAIEIYPGFAPPLYRRGLSYFREDRYAEAKRDLGEVLKIAPGLKMIRGALGDVLFRQGKTERAQSLFERLVNDFPDNVVLRDYLGGIMLARGRHAEAADVYRAALDIKPDYRRALEGLGIANMKMGRLDEAEQCYKEAIVLPPDSPDAYYNLACLYSRKGDSGEAMRWLRQALDRGFANTYLIRTDPDLENLRKDDLFAQLGI